MFLSYTVQLSWNDFWTINKFEKKNASLVYKHYPNIYDFIQNGSPNLMISYVMVIVI